MRGRWAQGIVPRHFTWILKEQFAVCERPGGYGDSHRRVRRQEEIIWLIQNEFDRVVSVIPGPQNLHNYDEQGLLWRHVPFNGPEDGAEVLGLVFGTIRDELAAGRRILLHHEELGDRIAGVVGGYLLWAGLVPSGPNAITVAEQLLERELGPTARQIVTLTSRVTPSDDLVMPAPVHETAPPIPEDDEA